MTLRARAVWNQPFSLEAVREARRLYEEALRLDERNLGALIGLADTHMREVTFYGSKNRHEQIGIAEAAATQALTLAPDNALTNFVRGTVLCAKGAQSSARHLFDVAIALDGNLARAHAYRGLMEIALGRAETTEAHVVRALRLSPKDPMSSTWELCIGIADLYLGRLDKAVGHLQDSVALNRNCGWAQMALAVALALRGGEAEQLALVRAEARRIAPNFTVAKYRSEVLSTNPVYLAQRQRFIEGLRLLGIPEQ
jgi:tetratricopeptide (TPR) repeat protein